MGAVNSYFRDIVNSAVSIFEGMAVTMSWMVRKPVTIQYPYHPSRPDVPVGGPETLPDQTRGLLEADMSICTACVACERACPISVIRIDVEKRVMPGDDPAKPSRVMTRFDIDTSKCMFCGLCSESCPTGALHHTRHFEAPASHVENLVFRFIDPASPVLPYKVKKGEEPQGVERGNIIKSRFVERSWDLPAVEFPPEPQAAAGGVTAAPQPTN